MRLRPATATDHATFARLFLELGVPDPAPDPARFEAEIAPDTVVLELEGAPVGYGYAVRLDDALYVRQLVVDPSARRRGLGRYLLGALLEAGAARGASRACLYVAPDNAPAIALYRSFGFEPRRSSTGLRIPFDRAARLRGDGSFLVASIDPTGADDGALERDFALLGGQLGMLRAQGRVLLVARDGGAAVGVASFDPGFPGAFPFRARDAAVAGALLEAMAGFADPSRFDEGWRREGCVLVVEGDEALTGALLEAGAELTIRTVAMETSALPAPGGASGAGGPDIPRPS